MTNRLLDAGEIKNILEYGDRNEIDLIQSSYSKPILLVFLRHFGCTFCREALSDIKKLQGKIANQGFEIVFVHMSDRDTAAGYLKSYKLDKHRHISDPECRLYAHFGLVKGNFKQLFGLQIMLRGYEAGLKNNHGLGLKFIGDGFQMPGIFIIQDGKVQDSYIHEYASDRPDYESFINCCAV